MRILIGVLTGWQFRKRRERCQRTWMAEENLARFPDIDVVFLFGCLSAVKPERQGRCLFLPCPNNYQALPQRTRWFCEWALTQPDWDYLFKCDDDIRLDLGRLANYDTGGADYIGHPMIFKPDMQGHLPTEAELVRGKQLFASGPGYFLSRRAASLVALKLPADISAEGSEDRMVGLALAEAGIPLRFERTRFHVLARPGEEPGPNNDWVYTSPGEREPE